MIKVLVVDDNSLLRKALEHCIEAADDMELVGTAANGRSAVILAERHRPDVVTMDVSMPILDGVAATREIRQVAPQTRVIMFTFTSQADVVHRAYAAGAAGYLLKVASPDTLCRSIREVHEGGTPITEEIRQAFGPVG